MQQPSVAITKVYDVLLVTMQPDLDATQLQQLNTLLGKRVSQDQPIAVVLDFSTVFMLSMSEYQRIQAMLLSLRLLGPQVAITNLCSEIVIYMAEMDAKRSSIQFFLNLDDAMEAFAPANDQGHDRR